MPKTKRGHRQYADNWSRICFRTRRMTLNRCVNCLAKAEVVHHFYYRKGLLQRRIYGQETPLIDVVPLCCRCHGYVHKHAHWIRHRTDPDCDRNASSLIWSLRIQSWLWALFALPLRLLGFKWGRSQPDGNADVEAAIQAFFER